MAAPGRPARLASTIMASSIPVTVKLDTAIISIVVRRKAIRMKTDTPSASWRRSGARSRSRFSWNRVRINSSEPVEKAYDTASAMNGTERATPNSVPPSGGAPSRTIDSRAWTMLAALAICGSGTTARNAPLWVARKITPLVESTKATTRIRPSDAAPVMTAHPSTASAAAPTMSDAIMSRRRSNRSAAIPAARPNTSIGANSIALT